MGEAVEFLVPGAEYRVDADMQVLWNKTGVLLEVARKRLDGAKTYSVVLSRVARELRREHGVAVARQVLQGFVDTMEAASANDRPGGG